VNFKHKEIAIFLVLGFALGFILSKCDDRFLLKQPKEVWITDNAVAFPSREAIREFNQDIKGREEAQKESIAAAWITSERVIMLPAQKVFVLNWYGKMLNIKTDDGSEYWIQSSMIENKDDNRDVAERMVRKR